jgi:hypothetical protein
MGAEQIDPANSPLMFLQVRFPLTLVPNSSCPSLSTHQQYPDAGWHCIGSYEPSGAQSGIQRPRTLRPVQPRARYRSLSQFVLNPIKEAITKLM